MDPGRSDNNNGNPPETVGQQRAIAPSSDNAAVSGQESLRQRAPPSLAPIRTAGSVTDEQQYVFFFFNSVFFFSSEALLDFFLY